MKVLRKLKYPKIVKKKERNLVRRHDLKKLSSLLLEKENRG